MPRISKAILENPEVQKAVERATRDAEKNRLQDAQNILKRYESEYEHAKEVFFQVNGARRVLKNAEKKSE